MSSSVFYWNLIRSRKPNIQVRVQILERSDFNPCVALGDAIWLACNLEDKPLESQLFAKYLEC